MSTGDGEGQVVAVGNKREGLYTKDVGGAFVVKLVSCFLFLFSFFSHPGSMGCHFITLMSKMFSGSFVSSVHPWSFSLRHVLGSVNG